MTKINSIILEVNIIFGIDGIFLFGVHRHPFRIRRVKINSKANLVITTFVEIASICAIYTSFNYLIVTIWNSFLIDLQFICKGPDIALRVISVFKMYHGT